METLLINLATSEHRLTRSLALLKPYALPLHRIDAVDGRTLSEQELHQHYDANANQSAYHKPLNPGEIGCYLSHRKAWQYIIDQQLPWALVLEDDFDVCGDLGLIPQWVSSMPQDWDYIKLAESPLRRRGIYQQSIAHASYLIYDKIPARTCAQLVSLKGAGKLLAASERFARPVDIDLQYWWESDLSIYGIKPYPFAPNEAQASDIDSVGNRKSGSGNLVTKWRNQWYFRRANREALQRRLDRISAQ